jgi:hypothetical protein
LALRIARETLKIESNAFLGGDNLLYRSSGAKISDEDGEIGAIKNWNSQDSRVILLKLAELVLDLLQGIILMSRTAIGWSR